MADDIEPLKEWTVDYDYAISARITTSRAERFKTRTAEMDTNIEASEEGWSSIRRCG